MRIDAANGVAEIGNILWGPRMAGTRIATEAQFLFAEHVFGLATAATNGNATTPMLPRSAQRTLRLHLRGRAPPAYVVKGENRDTAWFSIIDGEWPGCAKPMSNGFDPANFDANGRQKQALAAFRPGKA